ncbi:DUF4174 domain-containing protein [Patiriisocius marinus]|nr:DUF4174 domain-containing protein [Patiriisocius marinus]
MKLKVLFLLLIPFVMNAQDLHKHQWESRIIVISTPTFESSEAALQKSYLQTEVEKLAERKIKVYHVTNTGYTVDFNSEILMSQNSDSEISGFNVSLVGLDGTQKYQFTSPQPAELFFNLIDSMPMRQAEIKNK